MPPLDAIVSPPDPASALAAPAIIATTAISTAQSAKRSGRCADPAEWLRRVSVVWRRNAARAEIVHLSFERLRG